jgi:hypothetical protein
MSTSIATRVGMLAAAVAFGLTVAAVPADAAPQQSGAQLYFYRDPGNPNFTQFTIEGTFAMQQPDAQGYLNNIATGREIGGMEYVVYGDDEGDRDPVLQRVFAQGTAGIPGYTIDARPNGLHHMLDVTIPNGPLNEDRDGQDELYVRATFIDADGGRRSQVTNMITANY